MAAILTDLGEEWLHINDVTSIVSVDLGLYDDSTDAITDTENLADITTEPGGASYARQAANISVSDISGDVGWDNDNQESFDLSDTSSGSVDSYLYEDNFQATIAVSQGSAQDNLIATGSLSQSYTSSSVDTLNVNAGTAGVTVS